MGIKLVTFAAQTVTPQDDALIYETALQESGMIYGGAVTIKNANVLHVDAGHGALCGRKFTIEATDVPVPLTASGSLQGRIYIHMDLSDTGEPISFQVETASSLTPVIQQADVNINSGIYEINLATFIVDTSTISNLVNVAPFIDIEPDAEFNAQSNNPVQNKVITKAVGVPETIGGLASQEYNIGDRLISSDGQFYDVIAHISPNATIVLNGNVTLGGNIVDLINSLSSQISNLAKKSWYKSSMVRTPDFQNTVGEFSSKTLVFNNLAITPTEVVYIPTVNQWITQNFYADGASISGNKVTINVLCCGVVGSQYSQAGGYILYR